MPSLSNVTDYTTKVLKLLYLTVLAYLITEHTDDFVAHGFPAVRVEVCDNHVGCFADFLHKVWLLCGSWGWRISVSVIHIINPLSKLNAYVLV